MVDVLYSSTAPSGKLPHTIAKWTSDYGTSAVSRDDSYSEGLYIDYHHFDKNGITPRYEFGFGLCKFLLSFSNMGWMGFMRRLMKYTAYTNFIYSSLSISSSATSDPASSTKALGGASDLHTTAATVTASTTNSGSVTGAEVPQLYIGLPSSAPATAPKQLRGFARLSLTASASGAATFTLRRKDLCY